MVQIKRVEFVSAKKLQAHIYDDEKFSSFDEKLHLWFDIANFSFSFHQRMDWAYQQMRLAVKCSAADDPSVPQSRRRSLLGTPGSHLRHYATQTLKPW